MCLCSPSSHPLTDEHNIAKHVQVLVGSNFKERVIDSEKAWLIDFYAPWCGHCKTLMPKIKGLADEMAKDGAAMVGKCDLTVGWDGWMGEYVFMHVCGIVGCSVVWLFGCSVRLFGWLGV